MHPAASSPRARFTLALTGLLLLGLACPAWPSLDNPDARATLKGITAFTVEVMGLTADSERDGLSKDQLRTDLELRLRKAGIRVVSEPSAENGWATLYLTVGALKLSPLEYYALSIHLELHQEVALQRSPGTYSFAITWSLGLTGYADAQKLRSNVREFMADIVDQFINAYLEQNPKQ